MRLTGGEIAPRDGVYEREFVTDETGHRHRAGAAVSAAAGEPLPGSAEDAYEAHELRSDEYVPRDGVYFNNVDGAEHPLAAGERFPNAAAESDFSWVRKIGT